MHVNYSRSHSRIETAVFAALALKLLTGVGQLRPDLRQRQPLLEGLGGSSRRLRKALLVA